MKKAPEPVDSPPEPPAEAELGVLLGAARPLLDALAHAPGRSAEWRRYSRRSPWVLRVTQNRKPLMYLQPVRGAVKTTVLLGPRAAATALAGGVSSRLHEAIRTARVYPEGRPVVVRVSRPLHRTLVEQLVAVKLKPAPALPGSR